jgi:riboflavin biosynthesis pyrimidine reductase
VIEGLQAEGYRRILTEGGPRMLGGLIAADALDELFLTISPVIAGRGRDDDRPGIVDGLSLEPAAFRSARLLSLRRGGSFLFLRYRLSSEHPSARRAS